MTGTGAGVGADVSPFGAGVGAGVGVGVGAGAGGLGNGQRNALQVRVSVCPWGTGFVVVELSGLMKTVVCIFIVRVQAGKLQIFVLTFSVQPGYVIAPLASFTPLHVVRSKRFLGSFALGHGVHIQIGLLCLLPSTYF